MSSVHDQPVNAVVVGVGHLLSANRAIDAGVRAAQVTHRPLHLLHVVDLGTVVPWSTEDLAEQDHELREYRARAAVQAPDLEITYAVHLDDPAAALVKVSRTASLVVLGSAGLGQVADVVRNATTHKVTTHAECPVMVVPYAGTWDPHGPVVVGVDDAEHSVPAVEWAFDDASRDSAPLLAVHTWWWDRPNAFLTAADREAQSAELAQAQALELSEMLAGWREKYPDVDVSTSVVRGHAATVLEEISASTRLIVVGSRGRGGFAGLLLGSVSSRISQHAHCPVVVVPSRAAVGA